MNEKNEVIGLRFIPGLVLFNFCHRSGFIPKFFDTIKICNTLEEKKVKSTVDQANH